MAVLDNRIPPPVVTIIVAAAMLMVAQWLPVLLPAILRYAFAGAAVVIAASYAAPAFVAFRRADTTTNPVAIDKASALVTGGVYARSRNPMYVGLLLLLTALAIGLGSPWLLAGPGLFMAYITRFQIMPEERVMAAKFGNAYGAYCRQVRRWF